MRKAALAIAVVLAIAASGCRHHEVPAVHRPRPVNHGAVVVIPTGHSHDARCGHYRYRGNWHQASGHVHSEGCGHVHRGGHWVHED